MELYIRIKDGQPFEHPIFVDNFMQAFPNIDVNNLPEDFARFVRIPQPSIGPYERIEGVTYEWVDGVVKDVWHITQFTEQEKIQKQDEVKASWAIHVQEYPEYSSWTFDENMCTYIPPEDWNQ